MSFYIYFIILSAKIIRITRVIKLKVFLDDPDNIEKFKDNAGNPLPPDLRDWEQAVKQPAAKLKAEYSLKNQKDVEFLQHQTFNSFF